MTPGATYGPRRRWRSHLSCAEKSCARRASPPTLEGGRTCTEREGNHHHGMGSAAPSVVAALGTRQHAYLIILASSNVLRCWEHRKGEPREGMGG